MSLVTRGFGISGTGTIVLENEILVKDIGVFIETDYEVFANIEDANDIKAEITLLDSLETTITKKQS